MDLGSAPAGVAQDRDDVGEIAHRVHDILEVAEIADVYGDADFGGVPLAGGDKHFAHVRSGFTEDSAEVCEEALAVDRHDGEVYTQEAIIRFPFDGGNAFGFAVHEGYRIGAHASVDQNATATADVADDIIAGDGLAAG